MYIVPDSTHSNSEKTRQKMQRIERPRIIESNDVVLTVRICGADGIETPSRHPWVTKRLYSFVCSVGPGQELKSEPVEGQPDPAWRMEGEMLLENFNAFDYDSLKVEVIRVKSKSDPGTSNGDVLVGRARIPLPSLKCGRRGGMYQLVKVCGPDAKCQAQGIIRLSMHLRPAQVLLDMPLKYPKKLPV